MKRFARGALTLAFWLAVWAALALLVHRELLLPAPWTVVRRLCELAATGAFWRITAVSIGRVLLGVALAAACTISKTADALLRPLMTVVKSTPVASFVVLALIWIARDWLPVFIALLMVLPVVWSNVCTGIRSADPALLELARVYSWPRGLLLDQAAFRFCTASVRWVTCSSAAALYRVSRLKSSTLSASSVSRLA